MSDTTPESFQKPRKKAKKKKEPIEGVVLPPIAQPQFDFMWDLTPYHEAEGKGLSKYWYWHSEDKRYRVARVESEVDGIYFAVEFYMGLTAHGSWSAIFVPRTTHVVQYPNILVAVDAAERHWSNKVVMVTWTSNKNQLFEVVKEAGLAFGTPPPKRYAEGQRVERRAETLPSQITHTELASKATPVVRAATPVVRGVARARFTIIGFSVSSIIHWMGQDQWTKEMARKVINAFGAVDTPDSTIRTCLTDSKNPKYAKPAVLSAEQIKELKSKL